MTAAPKSPLRACYDVAVVGYGPVGATLANLLALRGLSVLVLDREADIYRLPRAIHFDGECMRVFQTIGIAERLAPELVVAPGMRFVSSDGDLLLHWKRPTQVGAQGWHASYRFHQPTLETLLRECVADAGDVDVRLRHEVFAVEPGVEAVNLRLEDLSTGRLQHTSARYVVGCDGARSTIRRFMGTELEDLKSHERWLVVDVLLKRERPDLDGDSVQFCHPARPATFVPGPGQRRRWELMLLPGEDAAKMSRPERVWALLAPWLTPDEAVLERPAAYTFHSVVARGWRAGRLLIAGDAAHQTPPFMGQGMCAGIRDAANLAWKLADVVQGVADDALLETYESERAPHVREFIETAVRLGGVIQTTDEAQARRRDAEMRAQKAVFSTPSPRLGPGFHDGGAEGQGLGGQIGEQPTLADGCRLDDQVGYHAALVVDGETDLASLAERAGQVEGLTLVRADGAVRAWLSRLEARAVLLRPDRYVAGRAMDRPGVERLIAAWQARRDGAWQAA